MRRLVWGLCVLLAWIFNVAGARSQDSTQYIKPYQFTVGGSATAYNRVDRLQNAPGGQAPQSSFGFDIAPSFGYIFSPSYSMGGEMQLSYGLQENNLVNAFTGRPSQVRQEVMTFSFVPEGRLYLTVVERLYGFAAAGPGYSVGTRIARDIDPDTKLTRNRIDYRSFGWVGQAGVGLLYFVRPTVAITLQGNYRIGWDNLVTDGEPLNPDDLLPATGRYLRQGITARLGFGIYFRIKRPEPIRSAETEEVRESEKGAKRKGRTRKRAEPKKTEQ